MISNQMEIQYKEKNEKLENFIITLQKYALAGQMFSDISHELNNIVGAMLGFAQIAKMTNSESDIKKCFEVIISCSEKAKHMNNSMLSYLQSTPKEERETDLNTIIHQSISLANKGFDRKGIKISFAPGSIPIVKLRTGVFQHAILNFLLNMKRNISSGEELKIATEYIEKEKRIEIVLKNGSYIEEWKTCFESIESFQDVFLDIIKYGSINKDIDIVIACWIIMKEMGGDVLESCDKKETGYRIKIPIKD